MYDITKRDKTNKAYDYDRTSCRERVCERDGIEALHGAEVMRQTMHERLLTK